MAECRCGHDCRWCYRHEVTASLLAEHEAGCVARPARLEAVA